LRDEWNCLDFSIVVTSWFTFFISDSSISVIRSIRILRTLRTLTAFPELRSLIKIMVSIIPEMGNLAALCLVTVVCFACIAIQLFSGILSHRCVLNSSISNPVNIATETWLLIKDSQYSQGDFNYAVN
jgi:hypothetical protein